jgi:NAD(P)-dependent dehydrogenase (short-subunit alcohol dehydrogenase family)
MPTALIVGASRGLGLGLAREFASRGYDVVATARDPRQATELTQAAEGGAITVEPLDIDDAAAVAAFAQAFDRSLDVLFVNAGIGGPRGKTAQTYSDEEVLAVFRTNAVAPVRLAKMLRHQVDAERGVIAFMTSMMGSQALNTSGGSEIYRASKAALNSFMQSFVAELGGSGPTVLTLHPGWVRTDMGGANAPLEVADSVRGLADVVENARGGRGHGFYDYTGKTLPW